jgi:hypothetical protein
MIGDLLEEGFDMARQLLASAVVVALTGSPSALASTRFDGAWPGQIRCSALLVPPRDRGPTSGPLTLTIAQGVAAWDYNTPDRRENVTGKVDEQGRLVLTGSGAWKTQNRGPWSLRFDGVIVGRRYEANGAVLSPDGSTKYRDCTMSLERAPDSSGSTTSNAKAASKSTVSVATPRVQDPGAPATLPARSVSKNPAATPSVASPPAPVAPSGSKAATAPPAREPGRPADVPKGEPNAGDTGTAAKAKEQDGDRQSQTKEKPPPRPPVKSPMDL